MLVHTVSQYLESHKRLIIPQLGALIVKQPGQCVVFSELLKRDDGVLRHLLCEKGISELEAAGTIDRFVFEVRHAMSQGESFALPGLGEFRPGANETIAFDYLPQPIPEPEPAGAPRRKPQCNPDKIAEKMKHAFEAPYVSPSAKMNPDPSIRGLCYGKPHKNTDAYSFVDKPPRRRADRFIWIAAIAAALAIAAIAFGYFRQARERQAEAEPLPQIEQTEPTAQPTE